MFLATPKSVLVLKTFENNSIIKIVYEVKKEDSEGAMFWMSRLNWLPPMLEKPFLENKTAVGLMLIESHMNIAMSLVAVTSSGILYVVKGSQFHVLVGNFVERWYNFQNTCSSLLAREHNNACFTLFNTHKKNKSTRYPYRRHKR